MPPLFCRPTAAGDASRRPSLTLPYADEARPLPAPHAVGEGVEVGLLGRLPVADVARGQQRGARPCRAAGTRLGLGRRYGRRRRRRWVFGVCMGEVDMSLLLRIVVLVVV